MRTPLSVEELRIRIADACIRIADAEFEFERSRRNYRDAKLALEVATNALAVLEKELIAALQRGQE